MEHEIRGLLSPFRRDRKQDFASDVGAALLRSKVLQVLMTTGTTARSSGELPWRAAFGSGLDLLRHERNDEVLAELARVRIRDALQRWLPRVELSALTLERADAALSIRLRVREAGLETDVVLEGAR